MRKQWASVGTIALAAFTIGALLGRRWRSDVADLSLTLVAIMTIIALVMMLVKLWRDRLMGTTERDGEGNKSVEWRLALSKHIVLGSFEGRWILRLEKVGSLEFFEISLKGPSVKRSLAAQSSSPEGISRLSLILFGFSLGVYALTRLAALDQFPIYFFADEAIEGVLASQLLQNGWRDNQGHWLPVFFNTYGFFNPLFSVYFHAIGIALLGKSIIVTRATSAVITLVGSAAVGLILRFGLRVRYWWMGVLCLSAIPAWFLHSRTAFETAIMVSLYACFLLMYVLYRYRSPLFVFPALALAAGTFYSYGNGQLVIGLTGILLIISDWRYHLANWRILASASILAILLALPYFQYQREHPSEAFYHLRTLDTYLFRATPLEDKVRQFVANLGYGLSPQYWFLPNGQDLSRHRMKDYGNISLWMLPLFLLGAGVCLRHVRSSAHRMVLIAAVAAPIGGVLTQIAITRVLTFVIPAGIFVTLGIAYLIDRIQSLRMQQAAAVVVLGLFTYSSVGMLGDALTNGPFWFRDYGLYGMQWGAKQLFDAIPTLLAQSPSTVVNVTSTWANGTDVFLDYFLPNEPRVRFSNVDALIAEKHALESRMIYVMTPEEVARARNSGKFKQIQIDRVLSYPDGSDGFAFARLAYVDNIDQVFAAEAEERKKPVVEQLVIDGASVRVSHSLFDGGRLDNLFDNDPFTLARVMEANPAVLEFTFPSPRRIGGLAANFGTMDFSISASLFETADSTPVTYTETYKGLPPDPHIEMVWPNAPSSVTRVRIEVQALDVDPFKIHIRELKLK